MLTILWKSLVSDRLIFALALSGLNRRSWPLLLWSAIADTTNRLNSGFSSRCSLSLRNVRIGFSIFRLPTVPQHICLTVFPALNAAVTWRICSWLGGLGDLSRRFMHVQHCRSFRPAARYRLLPASGCPYLQGLR